MAFENHAARHSRVPMTFSANFCIKVCTASSRSVLAGALTGLDELFSRLVIDN